MPQIKRYPNRKLYNTEAKRYVTLDDITEMIREGDDITVIDHESGDDLTTLTLTQIILEQEKKKTGFLPRSLLTSLIRTGGDTVEQVVRSLQSAVSASEDSEQMNDESSEEVDREEDEMLPAKTDSSASHAGIDERISDVLHMLNVPTHGDMRKVQKQLDLLNEQLSRLATSEPDSSRPVSGSPQEAEAHDTVESIDELRAAD